MGVKGVSRRDFIKRAGLGLVTAGFGVYPLRNAIGEISNSPKILYRTLGRTKLKIPLVSFGVDIDNRDLINKSIDMGIRHFDTAHVYQCGGYSENVIGQVLEERKCREDVYVATKLRFARDSEKKVFDEESRGKDPGATVKNFNELLATSLARLRTDYVDILYLHCCEGPLMPTYEPMIELFVKARESGKVRYIGISTHSNDPDTIRAAADVGIWDIVLTSYSFLQKNSEEIKKAIKYAAEKGLGVIAMKTIAGGMLKQNVEVNHRAALKWALNNENICTAVLGIRTFEQLYSDLDVMRDITLSDEEKRDLKISSMITGPFYCQQCRACISSCPHNVEIPTLMRAYMYAEGYGDPFQAQLAIDELPRERNLTFCEGCPTCTAICPNGIDIRERLDSLITMGHSREVFA